jgi:hypothetical protein
MRPGTVLTIVFLLLVAIAHLLRVLYGVEVTAGGLAIPMWMSVAATLLTGALALLLWREAHR